MSILPLMDALRFGWEATKKNFWFLLGLFLLYYIIQLGIYLLMIIISMKNESLGLGLNLLSDIVSNIIFATGSVAIALKLCDGLKPRLSDFICDGKTLLFYFFVMILLVPLLIVGFLLLIFPGIYLSLRFSQVVYFIVEQKDNPIDAIKHSWEATQEVAVELFVYYLLVTGLMLAGFMALIVGIIPAYFVTLIASAYIYRVLNQRRLARLNPPAISE